MTGAGSPAGIMVYEGSLLPRVYWNTMIHAEPLHNVVRAYPVEADGAGYRGRIVNILEAVDDPLFRPVDVAAAPDGSLFIADWYDPGVGGHNVGDQNNGRIIRVAPKGMPYRVVKPDLSRPAGAAAALQNPDLATRYLAYTALLGWGNRAESVLVRVWRSENPRFRARALWLLAQLPGRGTRYIEQALRDADPDIRITGLRAVRLLDLDVIPYAKRLVNDPSPQVRREVAIALRHNPSLEAAQLWTQLALQHDGRDRWYLEALGIAADRQWDRFFAAWREAVGEGWREPAGRDIVWRARTDAALPLLATLIQHPDTVEADRHRYFRAFDFHRGPEREQVLLALLEGNHPAQAEITALALTHLDADAARTAPGFRAALERTLDAARGSARFVRLSAKFEARHQVDELVRLALAHPEESLGVEAARLALQWQGAEPLRQAAVAGDPETARRALVVLGRAGGVEAQQILSAVMLSDERALPERQAAVRALGQNQTGERMLLQLVEQNRLPEELEEITSSVLFASYRVDIREAATKHLPPPAATTADGKILPPLAVLAQLRGDAARGQNAYDRACLACHVVGERGIDFGPNLSEIGDKLPRIALYNKVLNPNAGISFNYAGYVVKLRDGTEMVGIISSDTETELALRLPGGISTRYRKEEVASRTPMDVSLMPPGLERALTEQELVDLVEYLASLRR
jgi:putative heme-binding domain-containing protein